MANEKDVTPAPKKPAEIDQEYVNLCARLGDLQYRMRLIPTEMKELQDQMDGLNTAKKASMTYWAALAAETQPKSA